MQRLPTRSSAFWSGADRILSGLFSSSGPPEQWGERRVAVSAKSQPYLILGYHIPDAKHKDSRALEAMANILGQGRSSRLYTSLVKDKKIAVMAASSSGFPSDKFQSVGIINMAATWLPNFAISAALKDKQKRYPDTIYVRDYKKVLVNAWKIADDSSNVLAFDKNGRLIFRKDGKLTAEEIQRLIQVIRDHL
jgi:predicted Zn-dependent peptidase